MNKLVIEEVHRLGGDAADPVWNWLLLNGPHGSKFTWGQTRTEPPGYVGVEHLERIVAEKTETQLNFRECARAVVRKGFASNNVDILRRALQVAAVVGGSDELKTVERLRGHPNHLVAADARASAFYLKKTLRSGGKS